MKKIYTVTLDNDEYPSGVFSDNLRIIAHFVYHYIYNYDDERHIPLNINKNITYNNLYERNMDGGYYLDSDEYDDGVINYEPFIVGNNSFGLTVDDDRITEDVLNKIVLSVMVLLGISYKVVINSVEYYSKDKEDERFRKKAIKLIFKRLGCKITTNVSLVRRLVNGNKYRNRPNVYLK